MAGSQDQAENPVAVNVVPMVDVIFCLCVFFMCSFKFKQVEAKFENWLPRTGIRPGTADPVVEMRVAILWDEATASSVRRFGARRVRDDAELAKLLGEAHGDAVRSGTPNVPVTIDADARVPWQDVVDVINVARRDGLDHIEFALGAPPPR